jgi:peptide chain release factor 3
LEYVAQGFRRFSGNHLTSRAVPYIPSRQVDTWLRLLGETTTNRAPNTEISRRRIFAIISHPDAGKTTLTEKLLLFGGAIQDAGAVKARADQRRATSDWMEIEKQRGISVTSTVLSFAFNSNQQDYQLNLVDTPGHQDFSEDTYRTLAAADNCVMLIDAAKGIEERTRKLFDVCQMRKLPIFTFVNKMDRPSLSPVEVIDQLEKEFSLQCIPMNWPIGDGNDFQGVYDRQSKAVHLFQRGDRRKKISATVISIEDPELADIIGHQYVHKLMEDIEMLDSLFSDPNIELIQSGDQSPVFFGSAMTNFGVELFLQRFLQYARPPAPREAQVSSIHKMLAKREEQLIIIPADHDEFSGFVFKLQANLDPKHRDRMAFIRICSGVFQKGMKVYHSRMLGNNKQLISLSSAQSLFAQERDSVSIAYPGDIIGVHNPGFFTIGDTLFTGSELRIAYPGIPSFSPEKFVYIRNTSPSGYKKFQKGLSELLDEGAVQMLRDRRDDGSGTPILAAVGPLQLDVVEYRLLHEYGVTCELEALTFSIARWVACSNQCNGRDLNSIQDAWEAVNLADKEGKLFGVGIVQDRWQRPVLLFRNPWKVTQVQDDCKNLKMTPWAMPPMEYFK